VKYRLGNLLWNKSPSARTGLYDDKIGKKRGCPKRQLLFYYSFK